MKFGTSSSSSSSSRARGTATAAVAAAATAASYAAIGSMLMALPAAAGIPDLRFGKKKKPLGFGNYYYESVVWEASKGPCAGTQTLSADGRNPCGVKFSLGGHGGLTLEGCGGPSLWVNQNGQWAAGCAYSATGQECSTQGEWYCRS
jgi:hypothetical protein